MSKQERAVVLYDQGPSAGLALAAIVFLGAAAIVALACIVMAKFGKSLVNSPTLGGAVVQSLAWALAFTVPIAISSFIWMAFPYGESYSGGFLSGPGSDWGIVVAALVGPAIRFFADVAISLFVANRIKFLVGDRKWLGTTLTALAMFAIFGASTVVALLARGLPYDTILDVPGIVAVYLMDSVKYLAATAFMILTDFMQGWQMLLAMIDVKGNFFNLTDVMSKAFFIIAVFTGIGFAGTLINHSSPSDSP